MGKGEGTGSHVEPALKLIRKLLPRTWVLRYDLRGISRVYRPLIAAAKEDERRKLVHRHMWELASIHEELESIQTGRLIRQARKYYSETPQISFDDENEGNRSWQRGWASDSFT
jgi:hypothetical protein